jgi:hypothetical protein
MSPGIRLQPGCRRQRWPASTAVTLSRGSEGHQPSSMYTSGCNRAIASRSVVRLPGDPSVSCSSPAKAASSATSRVGMRWAANGESHAALMTAMSDKCGTVTSLAARSTGFRARGCILSGVGLSDVRRVGSLVGNTCSPPQCRRPQNDPVVHALSSSEASTLDATRTISGSPGTPNSRARAIDRTRRPDAHRYLVP